MIPRTARVYDERGHDGATDGWRKRSFCVEGRLHGELREKWQNDGAYRRQLTRLRHCDGSCQTLIATPSFAVRFAQHFGVPIGEMGRVYLAETTEHKGRLVTYRDICVGRRAHYTLCESWDDDRGRHRQVATDYGPCDQSCGTWLELDHVDDRKKISAFMMNAE